LRYIAKRIITYIIVVVVALNLAFILPRLAPGNAAAVAVAAGNNAPAITVTYYENLWGLNKPLFDQYLIYFKNIFSWPPNLGYSFEFFPATVWSLLVGRIGWTILLVLGGLALALVMSFIAAGVASLRRGGKFDMSALYCAVTIHATPVYWIAMILLFGFGFTLNWFPSHGQVGVLAHGLNYYTSVADHSILPVVAMALSVFGEVYLLLRGTIQQVLSSDYVVLAKTRGLRDRVLSFSYILRNSMLPLVSLMSFSFAGLISRAVFVEAVFGYTGVGDLVVDAAINRDFPVLQGTLLFLTLIVVASGIIGDILLTRLDPRLRG
jgi:peptide/nickel transport system permease protein